MRMGIHSGEAAQTATGVVGLEVHRAARAERIFQLTAAGLPAGFPPLRSLGNPALPNNLPVQLSTSTGTHMV